MKPTILVTGASGTIGRALIPKLLRHFIVVGCARRSFETDDKNFLFEESDLANEVDVSKIFQKYDFDAVIHLAAYIKTGDIEIGEIDKIFKSNILSTFNILSNLSAKTQLIFASSITVYGLSENLPATEKSRLAPKDFYSGSKFVCEQLIKVFSRYKKFNYVILRIPGVFSKERRDGALFNFTVKALNDKDIVINLETPVLWDIFYIDDLADVILAVLLKKPGVKGIINVGYGEKIEITQLAKRIVKATGSKSEVIKNYSFENPAFSLDVRRLKTMGIGLPKLNQRLVEYINYMKGLSEKTGD